MLTRPNDQYSGSMSCSCCCSHVSRQLWDDCMKKERAIVAKKPGERCFPTLMKDHGTWQQS